MENKRSIGKKKEELAIEYLTNQGAKVLERNFYFKGGELDVIAMDGEYLCFVEVKYRASDRYGRPEEALNDRKMQRIRWGAQRYLYQNKLPFDTPCRFDVISIFRDEITWIKDAF